MVFDKPGFWGLEVQRVPPIMGNIPVCLMRYYGDAKEVFLEVRWGDG